MFIGHFAVGLAAKRVSRKPSLATYVAAAQLADLLWPVFLLLGIERVAVVPGITRFTPLDFTSYPISHSLLADAGWALLFGGIYFLLRKDSRGALTLSACVMSHWVLDWITHRPDMPLYPGGPRVGLGLWNHPVATVAVEMAMFAAGILIYTKVAPPRDRTGVIAFWAFIGFLLVSYLASIFSPPPPSTTAIALGTLAMLLFIPWAGWIDRHRGQRAD